MIPFWKKRLNFPNDLWDHIISDKLVMSYANILDACQRHGYVPKAMLNSLNINWRIGIKDFNYTTFVSFGKVSKSAKIRNWYNPVPHLTLDTNGIVTNSQLDTTNESQEVSHFPAGDHKAH